MNSTIPSNYTHPSLADAERAARREGNSHELAQWMYRMRDLAASGDRVARETLERIAGATPSADEHSAMKAYPDAYAPEFLERWKHLL